MMSTSSEGRLIARCRAGEAPAWDELFDAHYGATGRFIHQLSADLTPEDTEEICQETFLSVVRNLAGFHGRSRLQTWIFRIAANKARDYLERQRAAKRGGGREPVSLSEEDGAGGRRFDPPSAWPGPDGVLLGRERLERVGRALDELDPASRMAVELRYFGGLSYEEIGHALDCNLKTVSSRLSRALDRLAVIVGRLERREQEVPTPG